MPDPLGASVAWIGTWGMRAAARCFPQLLWRRSPEAADQRTVYLTFDDGPTEHGTARLLRVLDRFGAQATFFLIGERAQRHSHSVRQLVEAGHTVGNHTYTHPDPWFARSSTLHGELRRTDALLRELGAAPRPVRAPYGHVTPSLYRHCRNQGRSLVMWDVMPADFLRSATPERVAHRVVRDVHPGSIVVLHDAPRTQQATPVALERILQRLTAQGWRFDAL